MIDQVVTVQFPPPCRKPMAAPLAMNANAVITLFTIEPSVLQSVEVGATRADTRDSASARGRR